MKIVAAYLLVVLGGNPNPSADDIRSILESVGAEAEDKRINHFLAEVKGKDITEVIAAGWEKFASVPSCGSVAAIGVAAPGSGGAGGAPAAEEPKKEEKVEEKEESDEGMELYPRISKNFDIKVFTNCRFGMMSWAVLAVTYCIK
ncbi:60S acidic ribosomal protein P2B-like [Zingiber officinale]|uniref:60S acidic ribosomal protein P2B-like n=1 Tax=Zingiber officinale TaxID=94328 RepID=UPI001C4CC129|nr:60S acidic ribosomal protein P2B-like [Zingiber officinale]